MAPGRNIGGILGRNYIGKPEMLLIIRFMVLMNETNTQFLISRVLAVDMALQPPGSLLPWPGGTPGAAGCPAAGAQGWQWQRQIYTL